MTLDPNNSSYVVNMKAQIMQIYEEHKNSRCSDSNVSSIFIERDIH